MRLLSRLNGLGVRWVVQNTGPVDAVFAGRVTEHDDRVPDTSDSRLVVAPTAPGDGNRARGGGAMSGSPRRFDPRMALLETQCVKVSLSLLARSTNPARSLGFTSAVPGEGKSFLSTLTATALARQSQRPVTLVDCNWEHPTLHQTFNIPSTPGLAEWLRHECDLGDIRHVVAPGLVVIPAGDAAANDSVALTSALKSVGAHTLLTHSEEALIVDMAPVLTTSYGALLAQQLDAILLVVRAGATWDSYVQEASYELGASAVEGVVLNATQSRIPRWLQRIL